MAYDIILFEQFLVQAGLVALGLLIALYAIIIPNFRTQLIQKQASKFRENFSKLKEGLDKVKNLSCNHFTYNNLEKQIEAVKEYREMPFWLVWGVLFTVIFLSFSSLLPLLDLLNLLQYPILSLTSSEQVIYLSGLSLLLGVIGFIIIAIRVFLELKEILTGEFEDELEKANELVKKAEKLEEKIKKK
jgi:large-conductance mechanosensitive channel